MNWDADYERPEQQRWWPEPELIRMVTRRWPNQAGFANALEVGCGNARNIWFLAEHGFNCHGFDGSEKAIESALHHAKQRNFFFFSSIHDALPILPYEPETFDLVVDCQTFQHLPWNQHAAAYREVLRVLKPGGTFWSMHWAAGASKRLYPSHPELEYHSAESQAALLESAGFTIATCGLTGRSILSVDRQTSVGANWAILEATKPKET